MTAQILAIIQLTPVHLVVGLFGGLGLLALGYWAGQIAERRYIERINAVRPEDFFIGGTQ